MKDIKDNGIFYTPIALAEYLAKPLITSKCTAILDPSYGEGALLLAAERIFKKIGNGSEIQLFGCDTKPVNGLLNHLPEANLCEIDFFDYMSENMFQTILMNPPYIRLHKQNLEKIKKYRTNIPQLSILSNTADLWAYFLIKAVTHLQEDGNIGAILPWAFLQADYSISIRKWLAENFREIKVVALSNKYFEKAEERVVVIWLKGFGQVNNSIKIASSKTIESNVVFTKLPIQNWASSKVFYSEANQIDQLLSKYQTEFGFTKFINHADVKIGIVTGAVEYFIMPKQEAKIIGFKKKCLIPILRNSSEFSDYIRNGKKSLSFLVALKEKDHLTYTDYIKKGIEKKYHLRRHSILRKPWYSVRIGEVPDAFFHYRIIKNPYLIFNHDQVQCTNSIHRIYFKNLSDVEKKWIFVSFLSLPSQLSIETNSKIYGKGILKIEPSALKNALVIKRSDPSINIIYEQIINLLSSDRKEMAMQLASEFVYRELTIPEDIVRSTVETLNKLYCLRLPDN